VKVGDLTRSSLTLATSIGGAFVVLLAFVAVARADYTVNACGPNANKVFTASLPSNRSIEAADLGGPATCSAPGGDLGLLSNSAVSTSQGSRGAWQANAPAGLEIVSASATVSLQTANGDGHFATSVYWQGGSAALPDPYINNNGITDPGVKITRAWSGFASPFFGFQMVCGANPCPGQSPYGPGIPVTNSLDASPVTLTVHEIVGPSLSAPSGLWQANGWVRGQWPLDFSGDSPSGVCALAGTLNKIQLPGASSQRDVATWHQCAVPAVSTTINTALYGQGPMPLVISGSDVAGNGVTDTKTVDVDNSVPTLTLSGRRDASVMAGTQFVNATAGGSPSGIDQIVCSVDEGQVVATYAGPRARVPVRGLGEHQVSCTAYNNAVDPNGVHGASQTHTMSVKIAVPTVLAATVSRLARLRCSSVAAGRIKCDLKLRRVRVPVRVPLKRHGKVVKRHGKVVYRTLVEHRTVAVPPGKITKRVGHGRATTVSGWLGLADGTALAGQTVEVLTAPDNGRGQFTPAAEGITANNGMWTASLPAGPSRLIKATYAGSTTTERSQSEQVQLSVLVPAKVKLKSVTPRQVDWGQTVTIKGQLLGGYLPRAGINVRLRIGIANAKTTFGVKEHVSGTGNFTATFTFGPDSPQVHRTYWFQIASLPAGDYPYAPSASNRRYVQVGGHPHGGCCRSR
jgi:hypothetical protein